MVPDYFVDDFTLEAVGSFRAVLRDVVRYAGKLRKVIEVELEASIALEKAAVVASSPALARSVRSLLREVAGRPVAATKNLGIDFSAGKPRSHPGCKRTRTLRLKAACGRRHRLSQVAKAGGWRAKRLFSAGVLPAAAFGAEVNGMSETEMLQLRRVEASVMAPRAAGRSLTATLLINDQQSWKAAAAPISQLSRAVWQATVNHPHNGMSLSEISRAWSAARPAECKKWSQSRGPLAACALSLARIGWKAEGPFVLLTDEGKSLALTEHSPAAVQVELQAAAKRQLERALAAKAGLVDAHGKGAYVDHIIRLLSPSNKQLDQVEKGILRCIVCDGVWTQSRLHEAGYDVPPVCRLCNKAADTVHHRAWECPATSHIHGPSTRRVPRAPPARMASQSQR